MSMPIFSFATLAEARKSTAPEICIHINLPKSEKQLNEIFAFPNLAKLVLDVSGGFGVIPSSLKNAKNLRQLRIENLDRLDEIVTLPEIFLELAQLELLTFIYCGNLRWGDKDWSGLHNLNYLYIYVAGNCFPMGLLKAPKVEILNFPSVPFPEIPAEISQLQTLKQLIINANTLKSKTLPDSIPQLPLLEKLDINLQAVPDWIGDLPLGLKHIFIYPTLKQNQITDKIFQYTKLEKLFLYHVGLNELSPKVAQLKELRSLSLVGNKLLALPDELAELQQLEHLHLNQNDFKQMPGVLAKLPALTKLEYKQQNNHTSDISRFEKFLKWIEIQKPAPELRNFLADRWDGKDITTDEINYEFIEKALYIGISPIDSNTLYYLCNQSPQAYSPLQSGDLLVVVGKTSFKKNELKEKLRLLGISLTFSHSFDEKEEKITHLLIDSNFKVAPALWLGNPHICLMSEPQLVDFLNASSPDYLVEDAQTTDNSQMVAQVNSLLFSLDNANIEIALGLMKSGGVPEDCKTALFTAYKLAENATTRANAGKLLQKSASEKLRDALKKRVTFSSTYSIGYKTLAGHFSAFEDTELDMLRFALEYYKKEKNDVLYYLMSKKASAYILEYFRINIKDGNLKVHISYYSENIHHIPLEIFDLQELTSLNIYMYSQNWTIEGGFPAQFAQLKALQKLDIHYGGKPITEVPKVLTEMTWLQELKTNATANVKAELAKLLPNAVIS